ncbi:MAG TPA: MamK family actin-like protein [Rhodothermales bacterium]|nr:MamK family actin-like protein [Rhodothermales bacterium]
MPPRKKGSKPGDNVLHIGIDLGTSRSVVSASNGRREWVQSYVGWPKDFVARKMLGQRVLFGEEALTNRLSLNLVRPLEYGVIREGTERDQEAVRELVHHLIELAKPEEGQEIFAAVGVPAEALKVNKLAIRDAVKEYADALMVVSEPFSVAYGLGTLNNAMIIDIGAGTTDFCVMHGTMPSEEDQRTLTQAGDYVDQQLFRTLSEKHPNARFSEVLVRQYKEQYGFVGADNGKVKVRVPVDGKFTEVDITDELKAACERLLPSIAETAVDLISHYEPEFQEAVSRNIYLAGGGSEIKGVSDALEQLLREYGNYRVRTVEDPLFAGADGALSLAQDMPDEYWENM